MNTALNKIYDLGISISTPNIKAQGVGSAADIFHSLARIINRSKVRWDIEDAIEDLMPKINELMPDSLLDGVLVCVGIAEWERADLQQFKGHYLLDVYIVGAGKTPSEAIKKQHPAWLRGAPKGWKRIDRYIWLTKIGRSNLSIESITDGY